MAVSYSGLAYQFDGASWHESAQLEMLINVNSVSCPIAGWCIVAGDGSEVFTFAHRRWSGPLIIGAARSSLSAVSCATVAFCVAVTATGQAQVYEGSGWSRPADADTGQGGLQDVSCAVVNYCAAIDDNGGAVTFRGSGWSPRKPILPQQDAEVSCVPDKSCVATANTDNVAMTARFSDGRWGRAAIVDRTTGWMDGVGCPSPSRCLAVDNEGNVITDIAGRWTKPMMIDIKNTLQAISCPPGRFCVVAAGNDVWRFNGRAWAGPTQVTVARASILTGVSCVTNRFCAAVSATGSVSIFRGHRWTKPKIIDSWAFDDVSCATVRFCVAIDSGGHAIYYNGRKWSPPQRAGADEHESYTVSCPTERYCAAVDLLGNVFIFNGQSWQPGPHVTTDRWGLDGISCPATGDCLMTSENGQIFTYRHGRWAVSASFGPSQRWKNITCASIGHCVAVADSGIAIGQVR